MLRVESRRPGSLGHRIVASGIIRPVQSVAQQRRTQPRGRQGFSLVELLIVIAIIGALAALLMPALRGTRIQARRTACAARLKQIGVGLQSYLNGSRERFPWASYMPSVGPAPLDREQPIYLAEVLLPEVGGDTTVFACPNDESGRARPAPNAGRSYFESERSSYEYRVQFGGRTVRDVVNGFGRFGNRIVAENAIWILRDYDNFHGPGGQPGARRYLYLDGHVTDFEN